jgi:hypothetical protein
MATTTSDTPIGPTIPKFTDKEKPYVMPDFGTIYGCCCSVCINKETNVCVNKLAMLITDLTDEIENKKLQLQNMRNTYNMMRNIKYEYT